MANLMDLDCSSSWRAKWCLKGLNTFGFRECEEDLKAPTWKWNSLLSRSVTGHSRGWSYKEFRPLWLAPWPSLILKSLPWIILSNLFLCLLNMTEPLNMTELSLAGSFTLTCKRIPSANTDIMSNHPIDVLSKKSGQNQLYWEVINKEITQPKDFLCCANSLQLCSTLCEPMACRPPVSSVHGDSTGKNTGVGCYTLLQGILLTQWSKMHLLFLLHCHQVIYH